MKSMDFEAIKALAQGELRAVDIEIETRLQSDVALINQMGSYIVHSGGKRLRPMLVLLGSRAFGYEGSAHIRLAAIIEFIHTATLLHDDVVDASELRRGHTTANTIWGNEASVLVGDFLYSRAFEMMVEVGSMRVMEILAHTTNTIAKGEVMQLLNCHDPDTSEEYYLEVIRNKTAKLFQAAAQLAAVISNQNQEIEQAMANFGLHLGTAFQLIDDVLDYGRNNTELGKNIGDDLAEGKPTLPLIHTLRQGTSHQRNLIRIAIEEGGLAQLGEVMDAIESTGSITYTARRAEDEASRAMAALANIPDSPYKQALLDLAHFSAHRNY
jgi:octaprenyl-diphosphate synthase